MNERQQALSALFRARAALDDCADPLARKAEPHITDAIRLLRRMGAAPAAQRCALCGAFYPLFREGVDKVTCKKCGVVWERG